jgi:rRNA processing protein Gar1
MRKIGVIEKKVKKFYLASASKDAFYLFGKKVRDREGVVGKVIDVLGPAENPYLKILPARDVVNGTAIYIEDEKNGRD